MTLKIERAINKILSLPPQDTLFVAKGDRVRAVPKTILETLYPDLTEIDPRQKWFSSKNKLDVVLTKDVMKFLTMPITRSVWGIIPLNQLIEWAIEQNYPNLSSLREDFNIYALGGGECSVELALDSSRTELINSFNDGGFPALANTLRTNSKKILTDTPYIARYILDQDQDILEVARGSTEALMRYFPATIQIVETGSSLKATGWLRLAETNPKARILSSQNMLVINNFRRKEL